MPALFALAASVLLSFQPAHPDLSGRVVNQLGEPIENATVYIYTATVKHGYSTYCPSCWLDCGKHIRTDSSGAFKIESLDPELIFRILTVADAHAPTFTTNVDPSGGPITIQLPSRRPEPSDSRRVIRGRVLDPAGFPISGAVISAEEVRWTDANGNMTGRGGQVDGLDPIAATNDRGEFIIAYKDPADTIAIEVEARGLANQKLRLKTGSKVHSVKLRDGTMIRGRLVHNGKPVPNAQMSLSHTDRINFNWMGRHTIGTRDDGTFEFSNIPSEYTRENMVVGRDNDRLPTEWCLTATMNSVKSIGCTPIQTITGLHDGGIHNLGDIEISPGVRISGRIVLTDGKPVPPGFKIAVGIRDGWDSQDAAIDEQGRFTAENIPPGSIYLNPAVKHYRLSRSNPNLGWSLEGTLKQDLDDYIILLDPGNEDFQGLAAGRHDNEPFKSAELPK